MKSSYALFVISLFIAFFLEHLPMPEMLYWFKPEWVILMVTLFVLFAPTLFSYWLVFPVGLLLDVENSSILGLHCFMLALHVLMVHLIYRRFMLFNVPQQTLVVFVLIFIGQHLSYAVVGLVNAEHTPEISAWIPALSSIIIWPWLSVFVSRLFRNVQLHRSS